MVLVATQVKRRRGTTAENDAFTGAEGEITVDLTTHELRVHDGSTVGGHIIPTKDYSYSKTESDNLLSNKANVALDNLTSAGKSLISGFGMPSSKYDNLTLGATGTYYTAPANGYFIINYNLVPELKYFRMRNITKGYSTTNHSGGVPFRIDLVIPVSKDDVMQCDYNATGTIEVFRFYYAEGENNV